MCAATTSSTWRRSAVQVRRTARKQRDAQCYLHPAPSSCGRWWPRASRLWERRAGDDGLRAGPDRPRPAAAGHAAGRARHRAGRRAGAADRARDAAVPRGARHAGRAADGGLAARLLPRDGLRGRRRRSAARRGRWSPSWPRCTRPRTWWSRSWPRRVRRRTGSGRSGCRTCRRQASRTAPARRGCSATTSASWRSCCADQLEGRPRFSRDGTPVLDQPHVVVVLDGGDGAAGLGARRRPRACRA